MSKINKYQRIAMSSVEYLGKGKPINKILPVVSVCVPTYQHARFIAECLDSILSQEAAFPIEILIGEDMSSDGTREICIAYADKYPDKIRLFLNDRENLIYFDGRPSGRTNFLNLVSESRGEFIAICEGDDYWTDKSKLEQQVSVLREHLECSFVYHNASITGGHRNGKDFSIGLAEGVYGIEYVISKPWFIPTQSILLRRELLKVDGWFKHTYNGDLAIQLMLAAQSPYYFIDKIMSVYRVHEGGSNHGRKIFYHHVKQIETLSILNSELKFKYDHLFKKKIESLRAGLELAAQNGAFESAVAKMSRFEKALTFRYYVYLAKFLMRKLSGQ